MKKYIDVTQEQGRAFFMRGIKGKISMLNLLRFKETADYSDFPALAPPTPISGKEAYKLYMKHTTPHLKTAGGEVLFKGKGGPFVIGPPTEEWDLVLLVQHESVEKFMAFAQDKEYLKTIGHRTAALEDSRLLPIENF